MTPEQAQRAGHAQDRALLLGQKIRDEGPDDVQRWILEAFPDIDQSAVDLLIVLAAALPETIAGCARAWSWTDSYIGTLTGHEKLQIRRARRAGMREQDIARALHLPVEAVHAA